MSHRKNFHSDDDTTEINISPLIDMVFILLIFFIVTTVFVEEDGMRSNTPDPTPPKEQEDDEQDKLTLLIKKGGAVFSKIGSDMKEVGVGGVRAVVQPEMQREKYAIIVNVEPESKIDTYARVHDQALLSGAETVIMKLTQNQ